MALDPALLSAVEDAGLNATAPLQQRWLDGWLLRHAPGKARRSRCINALAPGRRPFDEKLVEAESIYRAAGLPPFFRVTDFSQPPQIDARLEARGWALADRSLVLVRPTLESLSALPTPAGVTALDADIESYAAVIGSLRGSTPAQIAGHASRLATAPVAHRGVIWQRGNGPDVEVLACAQIAVEGRFAGLHDVFTAPAARGQGLARALCASLLRDAAAGGARIGYLQVDAANAPALALYGRLGFVEGYRYHYRCPDPGAE